MFLRTGLRKGEAWVQLVSSPPAPLRPTTPADSATLRPRGGDPGAAPLQRPVPGGEITCLLFSPGSWDSRGVPGRGELPPTTHGLPLRALLVRQPSYAP